MNKTGIFYGSSTGTTETLAKEIAGKLGIATADIFDVSKATVEQLKSYDVLLLGSSTWGFGDLQDDWYSFLEKIKKENLSGKKVGLFGTGDSDSYSDTFCDAIGIIYEELQGTGCTFIGSYSPEDYSYSESKAEVDGQLVGLAIDDVNESNKTEGRMGHWIKALQIA